ncbi:MAG: 1-acyl-sn-glycerol-3-phosphate acyltransferase [Caldilineaceae bacterium]|nr:1-acyl-sn-glycerol-3-phosphate acyltransferase [Caldilineaceae bacterium]
MRALLIALPVIALYVALAAVTFVPLTWIIRDIRPIYWVARQGCRLALALAGVRVRFVNLENTRKHRVSIFVSNHVSNLEPPALLAVLPRIAFILKKELRRIPLLGYIMGLGSFIYVDRTRADSRHHALEQAKQTLADGVSLMIFPEGTRSRDGQANRPGRGAAFVARRAGVPLVPVALRGTFALWPATRFLPRLRAPGGLGIRFLEPLDPAAFPDDAALIEEAMRQVYEALGQEPFRERAPQV